MDEHIAESTADFIKHNAEAGRPFFTYVCFTEMHPPLMTHPEFTGKSGGGPYSDTLTELDYRAGPSSRRHRPSRYCREHDRPVDQRQPGDQSHTQPVAPTGHGVDTSARLRGRDAGSRDGPLAGQGPAGCTHRRDHFEPLDWLPTLATLIGRSDLVPTDRPIDGVDASDFLLGREQDDPDVTMSSTSAPTPNLCRSSGRR